MPKNILILSGSPRKGGTTDKLVSAFIAGAESANKKATLFRVADQTINGCLGCIHCRNNNTGCIQSDDMTAITEAFKTSDAIVFASPVYFFTFSAQLKLAIDRTYAVPNDKSSIKRAALLLSCGDSSGNAAEGAIVTYKHMLSYRKWEDAGVILVPGVRSISDTDKQEKLEQARKLGATI